MKCLLRPLIAALLDAVITPLCLAQSVARTELIFPLYVDIRSVPSFGQRAFREVEIIQTQFEIINPNPETVHVAYQAFDFSGREIASRRFVPTALDIPGGAVQRLNTFASLGVDPFNRTGWVRVRSTQPVIVREEFQHVTEFECLVCGNPPSFLLRSSFQNFPSYAARHGAIKVHSDPAQFLEASGGSGVTNTIIAVAFPSSDAAVLAKGTLVLRRGNGELVATKEVSIPANGVLISSYDSLFATPFNPATPPPLPQLTGTLEFSFDSNVYVAAFQLTNGIGPKGTTEIMEEPNGGIVR